MLATSRGFFSVAGQRRRRADRARCAPRSTRSGRHDTRRAGEPPRDALGAELLFTADLDQSKALIREAVAMARRVGRRRRARPRRSTSSRRCRPTSSTSRACSPWRARRSEIAERIDDPALATMAASGLHVLACRAGDRVEADAALARQIEHTERARQPLLVFVLANALAFRAIGEGRLDEGERLAEDMLEVGSESGQPDTLVWMSAHVGLLWEEGPSRRRGRARSTARRRRCCRPVGAILVHTLAELGETDRARELWRELTADGLPDLPDRPALELRDVVARRGGVVPRRPDVCAPSSAGSSSGWPVS